MVTGWLQEQTCAFPSRIVIIIQYSNHVGNLRVLCTGMHRARINTIVNTVLTAGTLYGIHIRTVVLRSTGASI